MLICKAHAISFLFVDVAIILFLFHVTSDVKVLQVAPKSKVPVPLVYAWARILVRPVTAPGGGWLHCQEPLHWLTLLQPRQEATDLRACPAINTHLPPFRSEWIFTFLFNFLCFLKTFVLAFILDSIYMCWFTFRALYRAFRNKCSSSWFKVFMHS